MNNQNTISIKSSISNRLGKNSSSKSYYCLLPLEILNEFKIKDRLKVYMTTEGFKLIRANIDDNKTVIITNKGRINVPNQYLENDIEGKYEMNIIDVDTIELIKQI